VVCSGADGLATLYAVYTLLEVSPVSLQPHRLYAVLKAASPILSLLEASAALSDYNTSAVQP
jgi:hypothetical protein